jgi:O-acetyl-ADP-ribose deacetylase (regulator of RNase III)
LANLQKLEIMTGQERILKICDTVPELTKLYHTRVRHYTVIDHTLNVYNQFDKYFSSKFSETNEEAFRLVLLLHDIGKPLSYKNDNRNSQYSETIGIIQRHKQALNISDVDFQLYCALLSEDPLGQFMQDMISLDAAYIKIKKQCRNLNFGIKPFFYLLSVYYQCDVASYTVDAGGLKYLEHLFEYQDGCKIYNDKIKLLRFSIKYQNKYDSLLNKINGVEDLKYYSMSIDRPSNIKVIKGNIFNTKAQVIVNTVNCVGVMGKGVALVFKLRYPKMFNIYQDYCSQKYIEIGKLWLYKAEIDKPWVLNFPTKIHWKYPSKIEYIERGLIKFAETYEEKKIKSIAFPLLGTHNGGLDKQEVTNLMYKYLSRCNDLSIEIYEYDPKSPDDMFVSFKTKWNAIPNSQKKSATGIRTQKQIDTLDFAINSAQLESMISLIEYNGIGMKTMERCFNLIMSTNISNELF